MKKYAINILVILFLLTPFTLFVFRSVEQPKTIRNIQT